MARTESAPGVRRPDEEVLVADVIGNRSRNFCVALALSVRAARASSRRVTARVTPIVHERAARLFSRNDDLEALLPRDVGEQVVEDDELTVATLRPEDCDAGSELKRIRGTERVRSEKSFRGVAHFGQ